MGSDESARAKPPHDPVCRPKSRALEYEPELARTTFLWGHHFDGEVYSAAVPVRIRLVVLFVFVAPNASVLVVGENLVFSVELVPRKLEQRGTSAVL